MKTGYTLTVLGLSLALGALTRVSAQTVQQQTMKQPPSKLTAVSVKAQMDRRAHMLATAPMASARSTRNDGSRFTDSNMQGVTRSGNIGNETGTSGSAENGQIGTTNQGDMTRKSTNGAVFTSHFGGRGSRSQAAKAPARTRDNKSIVKNP